MRRHRLWRTEAIVLSRHDLGEADRILVLLTPDRGKVRAVARGTRKLTSRTGGHVELFNRVSVVLAAGRSLDVVTQAEAVDVPAGLRTDLVRTTYAYHVAELVDRLTGEGQVVAGLYDLVRSALPVMAECRDPVLLTRFVELRLLDLLGYRPELVACVACGKVLGPEGNRYHAEEGGVICPRCAPGHPRAIELDERTYRVLRFLQREDWAQASALRLTGDTQHDVEAIMVHTLRHVLEREMKSVEFLANLRSLDPPARGAASPRPHHPARHPQQDDGR